MRTVEADRTGAIRGLRSEWVAQLKGVFRNYVGSKHNELPAVSDVVDEQRLAVKVEQRVEPGARSDVTVPCYHCLITRSCTVIAPGSGTYGSSVRGTS